MSRVARRASRVVRQRRSADDVDVADDAPSLRAITQLAKHLPDVGSVEQRLVGGGHATPSSPGATKIPRLRKLAGACTIASTRAAAVLNGNQKAASRRSAVHAATPRPSRVARNSANAATKTSHPRRRYQRVRRPATPRAPRRARACTPHGTPRRDANGPGRRPWLRGARPVRQESSAGKATSWGRGSPLIVPTSERASVCRVHLGLRGPTDQPFV